MRKAKWIIATLTAAGVAALAFVYSGMFNVAADEPHWDVTVRVMAAVRDRSVAVRAAQLTAPNLADPELIALGAEHYSAMCAGCHLAPGMAETELNRGLYPKPPDLSQHADHSPAESFWIIKHGLKMSGMPAWGVTHDDDSIWGMVAFLQKLPTLDLAGYVALTEDADGGGHEHGDHDHSDPEDSSEGTATPPDGTMLTTAESDHSPGHPDGGEHAH